MVVLMVVWLVCAAEYVGGRDERPEVEGDFGEWDDGNKYAHEDSQGFGVSRRPEDVGGDGIRDTVAEHEDANYGEACVQHILTLGC